MAELKLRRLTEHNSRLKEDLDRTRVKVSEAAAGSVQFCLRYGPESNSSCSALYRLIRYCRTTKDSLVSSQKANRQATGRSFSRAHVLTIYLSFSALQSGDQWINETTRIQAAEAHLARKRAEAVAVLSRSETWIHGWQCVVSLL